MIQIPGISSFSISAAVIWRFQIPLVLLSFQLGWRQVPVGATLRRELELPVLVENNVNALAMAERLYGLGRQHESFLPFLKDAKRPQFNTRIETIATNGLWKGAFASSRCIVPMRGYYEWTSQMVDGKELKFPHFIHGPATRLAAAGIAKASQVDGVWEVSASIVTREARDASGELHDRMPAFLEPDVYGQWLSPQKLADDTQKDEILATLEPVSAEVTSTITTYPVGRKVNNSRTVDPADSTLIEGVS